MKHVLVTVPLSPENQTIHSLSAQALLNLQREQRYKVDIKLPCNKPFENNLHHIINSFVDGGYDYWLSFDPDNPPKRNPLDLIEYDKDIIGLPTPVWHFDERNHPKGDRPFYLNAYDFSPETDGYVEHALKEGIQQVDAIGTGCFLIARRVFLVEGMRKGAFTRKLNSDGTVRRGNDLSFCERARNQGFKIFTHYDYPCMHFNNLEINEVVKGCFQTIIKRG